MVFKIDKQLEHDAVPVTDLGFCKIMMMNNRNFPWAVLVPKKVGLAEITDLDSKHRKQLFDEICFVSQRMQKHFKAHKMNIAALGNMVRQLHVYVIVRFENDVAWPKPVWSVIVQPYPQYELMERAEELRKILAH